MKFKIWTVLVIICICIITIFMLKDKILIKFYPDKYSDYVEKYSEEYGVDRNLVYAVIKQESNFREKAKSNRGACPTTGRSSEEYRFPTSG